MFPTETLLADSQGVLHQRLSFPLLSLNNADTSQVVESPSASIWRSSFPRSQMVEHRRCECKKCWGAIVLVQRSLRLHGAISSRRLSPTTPGLVECLQPLML